RSCYRGEINPTKTDEIREVGIGSEIFKRLTAWIAALPDPSGEGWVFPSERIVTALLPDNVLRRVSIRAWSRLDSIGSPSPSCGDRILPYTRKEAPTRRSSPISRGTASEFTCRGTSI